MQPSLEADLFKLHHNVREIVGRCAAQGIRVSGVIKGCSGLPECAAVMEKGGCMHIASSRLGQLDEARRYGITLPAMLIRIPMLSEVSQVIRLADISLNSEAIVLEALNAEAARQNRIHEVLLMVELGDLREGIYDRQELIRTALLVDNQLESLKLLGIAVNIGCYGSVEATTEKMEELVEAAEAVEAALGRRLELISGGGSTSMPRVLDGNMPGRINHLRIGEAMLSGRDLSDLWGYDMSFIHQDVFVLHAEVIEVRTKPSHPVGKISFDAFRNRPVYEDRGLRKRALLGIGKVDYGDWQFIRPREAGVEIIGASSDHTILDVEDAAREISVGDVLAFDLCYGPIVFLTQSGGVRLVIKNR